MISMRLSVCSQAHTGRVRWQCTLYRRPSLCAANTPAAAKQLTALGEIPIGLSRPEPAGLTWRDEAAGRRCSWFGLNSLVFFARGYLSLRFLNLLTFGLRSHRWQQYYRSKGRSQIWWIGSRTPKKRTAMQNDCFRLKARRGRSSSLPK